MRALLLFLLLLAAAAAASPWFWSTVRIEPAAERVGYGREGGITQWAWLGPASPWPDWAVRPDGATLRVRAFFEAAPGYAASGQADLSVPARAAAAQAAYAQALAGAGWNVAMKRFDAPMPAPPWGIERACVVEATKDGRVLLLSLYERTSGARGSLFWTEGPKTPLAGASDGPC